MKFSFLPKYHVNYYDYIIKWCFGISCNWCVSLDIAHSLALKSMKLQDFLVVKIIYLNALNFQETVEKSIKVHIKRVLLLIKNFVYYFAAASFEAIVCKNIFCGGTS